jgi:GT2 family glycosyltransferase
MIGIGQKDSSQFGKQARPVDFVTGCALMVSMDIFRDVGGLDPRFFAYFEEVEWCVRMARAGGSILHVPTARIWHKISPEARESSPIVHYYMTRNRLLFLRLTKAGLSSWLYTLVLDYSRTLAAWTLRPKWRKKAPQRKAMLRALFDFSRGRYGKMSGV